jgi:hypothetical protein
MTAIPLRGDRSAWNAASYQSLHANDIDASASAIHHTLGTGGSQAAFGDHTHELDELASDASTTGQLLTSDGEGYANWESLADHNHSGAVSGDGGKLSWDNVWSDAVHDHSTDAQGGKFNVNNLSSGAVVSGYLVTADGSGSATWSAPPNNIATLDSIPNVYVPSPNDGDVLSWNAATGSWVAYRPIDWRITLTQDTNTDDSDKIFTVPENYEWQILWIWVEYTSSGTAGARQLEIQIQDASSNTIAQFQAGVTQNEGLTYKYLFGIGVPDLTTMRDTDNVTTPLPAATFLSEGQKIRIWDNNTLDPTADDMIIRMQYASRNLSLEYFYVPVTISSTQLQNSDNLTLTMHTILASVKDTSQLQNSDKAVLSWRLNTLAVNDTSQTQNSDNTTVLFRNTLIVDSIINLQTSESVTFTQYQILSMNNVNHKLITDKVTLSIIEHNPEVVVQDSTQANSSENITITSMLPLFIDNSSQLQTVDSVGLVNTMPSLGMHNSTSYHNSDKIPVNNIFILDTNNSAQIETCDKVTITQNQKELVIKNASAKLVTDKVTLQNIRYNDPLGTQNSSQISVSDKVTLV